MSDANRVPDWRAALYALPTGAGVICRDYKHPHRHELATQMAGLCHERGLYFSVAGDAGLALKTRAGLHCPEALAPRLARYFPLLRAQQTPVRQAPPLITMAAHSAQALKLAQTLHADAALLSPVFTTQSHPQQKPLGVVRSAGLIQNAQLPVYALGGMGPDTLRRMRSTKLYGYAAIDHFKTPFKPK
ncbi:MAG: thiamine phosphate synthase [Parvibaculales bacterium]